MWEYKLVKFNVATFWGVKMDPALLQRTLNELGAEGWELVTLFDTNAHQGATQSVVATFKRPRE